VTPPPAASPSAAATGRHAAAPTGRRAGPAARPTPARHPLRLVPSRRRSGSRRRSEAKRARLINLTALVVVLGALLGVVVGQAVLANGQVRLQALQHELTAEQSTHRQHELAVGGLMTPARIVATATGSLGLVATSVTELPYVPLSVPLATPKVTPAPAPAPATTPTPTSAASTSTPSTTP
jgi:hypothetical protein